MVKSNQSDAKLMLTPSMEWILSGIFLKYKLIGHPDIALKTYVFVSRDGKVMDNMRASYEKVNVLYSHGYLSMDECQNCFKLTNKGFEVAYDKLSKLVGPRPTENYLG